MANGNGNETPDFVALALAELAKSDDPAGRATVYALLEVAHRITRLSMVVQNAPAAARSMDLGF
jgi:hypothetical protein